MKETNSNDKSLLADSASKDELYSELIHEQNERKFLIFSVFLGVIISILFGKLTFAFLYDNVVAGSDQDEQNEVLITDGTNETDFQFDEIKKAAYLHEGNVYVYDAGEKREVQIVSDASTDIRYSALGWKNSEEITFAKCMRTGCFVQTYNLNERKTSGGFEVDAARVDALRWSHKGESLAVLFTKNGQSTLRLYSGGSEADLYTMQSTDDIVYDYDDALYIRFATNNQQIMLVNTFVFEGAPSLVVLNLEGEIRTKIEKTSSAKATFGAFTGEDTIYFKRGEHYYVRSLTNGNEVLMTDRIVDGYNFQLSPDRTQFAYWTQDWLTGISTIWTYEIGTGKISRLKDQASHPVWLDDETLIFTQTEDCIQCELQKLEYKGLFALNLQSRQTKEFVIRDNVARCVTDNL